MSARDSVLLEYATLEDSITLAGQLCPACNGGRSGEHTLSVSRRDGFLIWNCHRASCGFRGYEQSSSTASKSFNVKEDRRRERWQKEIRRAEAVPDWASDLLLSKWNITSSLSYRARLGYSAESDRLILPITSTTGDTEGVVLRSLKGAQPKALTYAEDLAMAYYPKRGSDSLIIVEDQLSAIRASEYMNAIALLGTNLNEQRAMCLRSLRLRNYYIALDKDAIATQTSHIINYRSLLRLIPLTLKRDIKDLTDADIVNEVFEGISLGV